MALARAFSTLYALVAKIAQDESTSGNTNAKNGINEVIRDITREFQLPAQFTGKDGVTLNLTAGTGRATLNLANDVKSVSKIWFEQSGLISMLQEIQSDDEWLNRTDNYSHGTPLLYRALITLAGQYQIQIWPAPDSAFISITDKFVYSYWAQLVQLSADADVPALPYELDSILVDGGAFYVGMYQGDDVLLKLYGPKYEQRKAELRAWLIDQLEEDGKVLPEAPADGGISPGVKADYGASYF